MLTPIKYLKNGMPASHELWLNGLDIVAHCLQQDYKQSFYQDDRPATRHYNEWSESMQDHVIADDNFDDIYSNAYAPKKSWIGFHDDSGSFDTSAFIAGEDFCFEDERRVKQQQDSMSILIDIAVPYSERNDSYMVARHKAVYDLIAQCDSDDRPVQVIGVLTIAIPEIDDNLKMFIMVKDYTDSIFPSIWGALKTNCTTNSFLNVIMDYFIGTHAGGNGVPKTLEHAEQYFPQNEEIVIFGTRIKAANAVYK